MPLNELSHFIKQYDKKASVAKLLDTVSKNNAAYKAMLEEEFASLTKARK